MDQIGQFTPDNLSAGGFPDLRDTRLIPGGAGIVRRGAILGADFKPLLTDGTPDSVALEDVDAAGAAAVCAVALTGEFNGDALSTGDTKTAYEWAAELRKLSIFVRHPAP